MNEALSHITLGQVAVAGLVIWGLVQFGGRVWSWARRAVHFVDKLESIERQVHANGGSSLRDAVDRIASTQGELAQAQVAQAQAQETQAVELAQVRQVLEQHIADSTRAPRRDTDPTDADYRSASSHT